MECPHVKQCSQRVPVPVHLEPFMCAVCKSTESPWLCVDCGAVHCGRYVQGHAKEHYEQAKHCVSVDCYNLGVFCYICDEYIGNKNVIPRRLFERLSHHTFENSDCGNLSKSSSSSSSGTLETTNEDDDFPPISSNSTENTSSNHRAVGSNVGLENKKPNGRRKRRRVGPNQIKVNTNDKTFSETMRKRSRDISSGKFSSSHSDLKNGSSSEKKPKLIDERVGVRENKSQGQDSNKSKVKNFDSLSGNIIETRGAKAKENNESINNLSNNTMVRLSASINCTKNLKHGVVGLRNLGNSCFMNSVLQSLSKIRGFTFYMAHIPPPEQLTDSEGASGILPKPFTYSTRSRKNGFLSSQNSKLNHLSTTATSFASNSNIGKTNNSINVTKNQEIECPEIKRDFRTEEFLTDELRKILISLNTTGSSAVSPDGLFAIIWEVMPRFRGYQQQDAHEFLRYMLDRLHTELLLLVPRFSCNGNGMLSQKSRFANIIRSGKSEGIVSTGFSCKGRNSIVTSVFGGTLQNEVRCSFCGMESKKHDPFLDLSLDIPCYSGDSKLEDCLSRFVDVEELVDSDMYFCSNCKVRQKSTKRFWIRRLPNVLCLHLKRFRWSNYLRTKLDQYVQFPLTSLDMSGYLLKNLHGTRGSSGSNLYDLAAVIVHHGTGVGSGHYTAFAKKDSQWYHFNDSIVKPIEESMVAKCKAYILFYTRQEFKH